MLCDPCCAAAWLVITLATLAAAPRIAALEIADNPNGASGYSARSELARAQGVFDAGPSASTAAPHAVITHQIACVAMVKSVPRAWPAATTVPDTATPSAAPTCRLVDAIAAATPACDSGIPATALFVIAGFTIPSPTPNNA